MNWKQIATEYPGAFEELRNAGLMLKTTDKRKWVFAGNHIRELYDFFDERGIYVDVGKMHPNHPMGQWRGSIVNWGSDGFYPTRIIAEDNVFMKAFDLLDNQLKSKKGPEYTDEDMVDFVLYIWRHIPLPSFRGTSKEFKDYLDEWKNSEKDV